MRPLDGSQAQLDHELPQHPGLPALWVPPPPGALAAAVSSELRNKKLLLATPLTLQMGKPRPEESAPFPKVAKSVACWFLPLCLNSD